jgi:hypothetical protein
MVVRVPAFLALITVSLLFVGRDAAPALAEPITLRVEFDGLVGLRVLTLHSALDQTGNRYAITVDYATSGVAGLFVDVKTRAQVRGVVSAATVRPESFRSETRNSGRDRQSRVDYRADGAVDGNSTPPLPEPVPASATRGTVDNLTAYFLLERQLARTGSCALSVPVFDGTRRYDLQFTDAGQSTLRPAGGQQFEGNTIACRMQRRNLAPSVDSETDQGARSGTIWYARLIPGADSMVPVRMTMETQIGSVDGYLAEIHGRGVDLTLMK